MLRFLLFLTGILILTAHWLIQPVSANGQFIIFLTGIFFLGIPHGAADLLVAIQSAKTDKQTFSRVIFFTTYLSRIIIFGLLLYFLPALGLLVFLLFAAYHFGETDLYFFNTNLLIGKVLVSSYGLVILSVILLNNMEELQVIIQLSGFKIERFPMIGWFADNDKLVLSGSLLFFFINIFLYFLQVKDSSAISELFLVQFAVIVLLLFNMPLLLGFTFYFIVWHSVLSLQNITLYLRTGLKHSYISILKQISFYSALAFIGIIIVGIFGFMFISNQAIIIYIFMALAVLTVPHMQIMHDMYNKVRNHSKSGQNR
jgi:beta-carotene 15,15'-dioxygenase